MSFWGIFNPGCAVHAALGFVNMGDTHNSSNLGKNPLAEK
jgi:hypothetical protein